METVPSPVGTSNWRWDLKHPLLDVSAFAGGRLHAATETVSPSPFPLTMTTVTVPRLLRWLVLILCAPDSSQIPALNWSLARSTPYPLDSSNQIHHPFLHHSGPKTSLSTYKDQHSRPLSDRETPVVACNFISTSATV